MCQDNDSKAADIVRGLFKCSSKALLFPLMSYASHRSMMLCSLQVRLHISNNIAFNASVRLQYKPQFFYFGDTFLSGKV